MGRKQNRPASSAAAAAHLSDTPTFTSFAAATAHALPAYATTQPTPATTPWDESALQILKRLSKRDTTTKQRALADLNDHLNNLPSPPSTPGHAFVAAWGPAFRAALEHDAPTVRSAALSLMSLTVHTFRRLVQPIFPTVLPVWVAATGDLNPSVAEAAAESLLQVLPTPTHREKVVAKYANNLREYVVNSMARLSPSTFRAISAGAVAVLAWLLDAANTSDAIASVIDDSTNPLQVLAKGINKSTVNAAPQVCSVAVNTLSRMTTDNPAHIARAKRYADLSALVIRMREPAGWDLALTLLRCGWCHAFGDDFGKLPVAVRDAVTAPLPTGLQALLPLFDALPPVSASAQFAISVLRGMRNALRISDVSDDTPLVSVSYSLAALPTFLETACFVHVTAARRWLSGDEERLAQIEDAIFTDYISPACCLFFSGLLPSAPRSQGGTAVNRSASARKESECMSRKPVQETAIHVARLLRVLTEPRASNAFSSFAEAFINSIDKPNLSERLWRLEFVVDNMKEFRAERRFSHHIIDKLVATEHQSVQNALRTLAVALSKRATNVTVEDNMPLQRNQSLVKGVLNFTRAALAKLCVAGKLEEPCDAAADLGAVCSWTLWAGTVLDMENLLADIINAVRLSCTAEDSYRILALIVRAHKARRDFDYVSSWNPIHGKEYDAVLMGAMSAACSNDPGTNAAVLVATSVDPCGGSCVSEEVLNIITGMAICHMKRKLGSNVLDGIITSLLGSPLCFTSRDRSESFQLLTATSILRAPHVNAMMTAVLNLLRGWTKQDVVRLADGMIDVLQDAGTPLGNNEVASSYAIGIGKVVVLIGEESIENSVSLCEKLLPGASPSFTTQFLKHVPFRYVFGNGTDVPIRMDHLTVILETAYTKNYAGFMEDVESFVQCIEVDERARVTAKIADRYLTSGSAVHRNMLQTILSVMDSDTQNGVAFRLVSQRLQELLTHHIGNMSQVERIPRVIHLCSMLTNGECLDEFRNLLEDAVRIVRTDSFTFAAGVAIDIMSASLGYAANEKGRTPKPEWLKDLVLLCLRAMRRCLEQSRGATKDQLSSMEARAASLTCNALKCFGHENVSEDDIRFWTLRSMDALRSFVEISSNEDEISKERFDRLASISGLSQELIKVGEQKEAHNTTSSIVDEMSHWASWVSVLLLPTIEAEEELTSSPEPEIIPSGRNIPSELILKAAERGTLLTREGGIPLRAEHLYRLVPYLASSFALSREAVLTVLTHGATIDLHDAVSRSFPDAGFGDENEEIEFATKTFPPELRKALNWQPEVHKRHAELAQDVRRRELGYFLTWRLFLDLIRSDDEAAMRTKMESEDSSLRRVGVTYLRANPSIFAEFFSKCIEVVVDGSVVEQTAAAAAASKALEAEERAAQGIQLAQQEEFDSTGSGNLCADRQLDDHEVEEAVGHAAGIVFARALQRLPALSRDHVMDGVDRGTSARVESFVRKRVSPLLIAAEIRKVKEWGAFGGGAAAQSSAGASVEGELNARGSVAGREVWATYTFSDVTLEIGMRLPDTFPLQSVQVEARSRVGMSEARWRKTLLGMTTLLRSKDGTLAEAVELWRRNLDKTFQGAEECPICYSVLHLSTAALPKMQCRTCKNLFHSDCLCKWFTKSNSSACPLCRSAF